MTSHIEVIRSLSLVAALGICVFTVSSCWDVNSSGAFAMFLSFYFGWRYGRRVGIAASAVAGLLLIASYHVESGIDLNEFTLIGSLDYELCDLSMEGLVQLVLLLLVLPTIASSLKPTILTALRNAGYQSRKHVRSTAPKLSWFSGNSMLVGAYHSIDTWLRSSSVRSNGKVIVLVLAFVAVQFFILISDYEEWGAPFSLPPDVMSAAFILISALAGRAIVPLLAVVYLGMLAFIGEVTGYDAFDAEYDLPMILYTSILAWLIAGFSKRIEKTQNADEAGSNSHKLVSLWLLAFVLPLLFVYSPSVQSEAEEYVIYSNSGVSLFPLIPLLLGLQYSVSRAALSNIALLVFTVLAIVGTGFLTGDNVRLVDITVFDVALVTLVPLACSRLDLGARANARSLVYASIFIWCISPVIYGHSPRWVVDGLIESEILIVVAHIMIAELVTSGYTWLSKRDIGYES